MPRDPCPEPLVVSFASEAFLPLLEPWIATLEHLGVRRLRIYGLDAATLEWCSARAIEARPMPACGARPDLWLARLGVFRELLERGEDFIHSDLDAIWARNSLREGSAARLEEDLVFSQGTYWPPEVHDRQGFVLCCGWFRARPTPAAQAFFREVERDARTTRNDQASVNRVLDAAGVRWSRVDADYELTYRDRRFRCWTGPNRGTATIDGRPLTVALLPHREFQRLPESHDRIVVRHFLTPKGCGEKLAMLRDLGVLPP